MSVPPEVADPKLGPLLRDLLACVCAQLEAIGRPPCACCVVWGDDRPPADFCDCDCGGGQGQAWVRLVRMEPSQQSTAQARPSISGGAQCAVPVKWRAVVEAGVYRCIATIDDDGVAPSCEERESDAYGLLADLRALRVAFTCCDAVRASLAPLSATPAGNQGGCGGAVVQFAVNL